MAEDRRTRDHGFLRSVLIAPVVVLVASCLVFVTSTSSYADGLPISSVGPQNLWVLDALDEGGSTAVSPGGVPPSAEVSAYEASQLTTATTAAETVEGVEAVPKPGWVGLAINGAALLGGLAFSWLGSDHGSPALPGVQATATAVGQANCGWTTVPGFSSCAVGSGSPGVNAFTFTGYPAGAYFWMHAGSLTGTVGTGWVGPDGADRAASFAWGVHYAVYVNTSSSSPGGTLVGEVWVAPQGGTIANPSPGTSSDPAVVPRYIDSQITCKSTSGATQTFSQRTGPFTFDPSQPATLPEAPDMTCPAGTWLESGQRNLHTEGTDATQDVPLETPYQAPDWLEQQITKFPDCFPSGATMCQLELVKINVTPEIECHSIAAGTANPCADWWTDPTRKEDYRCEFGTTTVALKRCQPYKQTFSTGVTTATPTDPDADLADPIPNVDPTPDETPDLGDCVPSWTQILNPWWVYKGVTCAMVWTFVPKVSVQTRVATLTQAFQNKIPVTWITGVIGMPSLIGTGGDSSCPDWRVKVDGLDKNVVCDSSFTAAIRNARPFLTAGMLAVAFWPLVRSLMYASVPIIKPTPTEPK